MKIAFDAKRVYQNETGLGNYSRTLISSLAENYQNHHYYLCAPKLTDRFDASAYPNVHTITPAGYPSLLKSLWRSSGVKRDLLAHAIDIYHGLSHEIPYGIETSGIKSVVTIHDLIFERFPDQYKPIDRLIYRGKFKHACKSADKIIAISRQTKADIISFYGIPEHKIEVCYQSCNPAFSSEIDGAELLRVKQHYNLPDEFFLFVGSIIERKNLLNICKALGRTPSQQKISLIVIGKGSTYRQQVADYCKQNNLPVRFLSYEAIAASTGSFKSGADFPAIYRQASCMIYPSLFEGFGIPVLEAMWSRLPVITSNVSCMPETAGDAAMYVDPRSVDELAKAMLEMISNVALRDELRLKGWEQAQKFTPEKCAAGVMDVYLSL